MCLNLKTLGWIATVILAGVQWMLKDQEDEAQKLLDEVQNKYP